jgi:hypothetical protein
VDLFRQLAVLDVLEANSGSSRSRCSCQGDSQKYREEDGGRVGNGSGHQLVGLGIKQFQSWEVCPGLGLGKPERKPPPTLPRGTGVDPAPTGKVSLTRCLGSFCQIGTILLVTKAFSFSNYLDSWACDTGIVILGRAVQAQLMYL